MYITKLGICGDLLTVNDNYDYDNSNNNDNYGVESEEDKIIIYDEFIEKIF